MDETKNKVVKRIVYKVSVRLDSPLCVSAGDAESELTDADVLCDYAGQPFVPGSSLAGAMRAYLEQEKDEPGIFGYAKSGADGKEDEGRMSSLILSDLRFDKKVTTDIRDSVKLTDGKISEEGAKFDMEIVNTGAVGHFYAELVVRKDDNDEDLVAQLERMLLAIHIHEIRFGRKKTRGYGSIGIINSNEAGKEACDSIFVGRKVFDASNIKDYACVYDEDFQFDAYELKKNALKKQKYVTITVPLRLSGGISIRKYAAKKGEPDFTHITVNEKPVIPGTSMAGAIQHRMKEIMQELGIPADTIQDYIKGMFGFVRPKTDQDKKKQELSSSESSETKAQMSPIVFEECVLEGAKPLIIVRNAISRFEAATKTGALYKEKTYVGGTTTLTIKVRKTDDTDEWIGYLLLVLRDLENGYLAVGGQTSIGRGIFERDSDKPVRIDGKLLQSDGMTVLMDEKTNDRKTYQVYVQ